MYPSIYLSVYLSIYICMYIYICVCVFVWVFTCIYVVYVYNISFFVLRSSDKHEVMQYLYEVNFISSKRFIFPSFSVNLVFFEHGSVIEKTILPLPQVNEKRNQRIAHVVDIIWFLTLVFNFVKQKSCTVKRLANLLGCFGSWYWYQKQKHSFTGDLKNFTNLQSSTLDGVLY